MGIIYLIVNINPNCLDYNFNYIGLTTQTLLRRFKQHCYQALSLNKELNTSIYLHNAIRKYGPESFKIKPLRFIDDPDLLSAAEEDEITYLKSIGKAEYNIAAGGYNYPFKYMDEEKKAAIYKKAAETFRNKPKEELDRINKAKGLPGELNPNYGGSLKHKIGCLKYYTEHPGVHAGENNSFYGKHHSEETKLHLSLLKLGKPLPREKGEHNPNYGKYGIESSNHKCVRATFPDGSYKDFGSRRECGKYFGYLNNNFPPMNKPINSPKHPERDGVVVTYI